MSEDFPCAEQRAFIEHTINSGEQYHLLLGGAGTGKTAVVSRLTVKFVALGYKVVCLFPTHASKFVAIARLRREVDITIKSDKFDMGGMEADDATVIMPSGDAVEFKTIHSVLGLRMVQGTGRTTMMAIQDNGRFVSSAIGLRLSSDGKPLVVFVDEVSMSPLPFITSEETDLQKHPVINSGGLVQLLDKTGLDYKLIFTGDFNQLCPVKAPMSEFAERFMKENVDTHELKINHRSESQEIVRVGEFSLNHRGTLPRDTGHYSISRYTDASEFSEEYLSCLKSGRDTVALVYTNAARKRYENMAASAIHGNPDPIFPGNTVLVGASKTRNVNGEMETVLYSQELVKITRVSNLMTVPGTEWAKTDVEAPSISVERLIDLSKHEYYGVMSIGDKLSPAFSEYTKEISAVYKLTVEFGKDNPDHDLDGLFKFLLSNGVDMSDLFEENDELFRAGSRAKAYYNRDWSWNEELRAAWSPTRAAAEVAALMWAKCYYGVENQILPLKTVVAQTCHMAQGAGRDYVFVDARNIRKCRDREERRRLMYVACTRAKKKLFILE